MVSLVFFLGFLCFFLVSLGFFEVATKWWKREDRPKLVVFAFFLEPRPSLQYLLPMFVLKEPLFPFEKNENPKAK